MKFGKLNPKMILALVFLILAWATPLAGARADTMTLSEKYKVMGTNPDGSPYSGTVAIKVISDTTFTITWNIAGTEYKGFGMRLNDNLSATYTIDGEPGLVMYKVDGSGLNGLWAIRGRNGSGTERLIPAE